MQRTILVSGSNGQIGTELLSALRDRYAGTRVIGLDIKEPSGGEPVDFVRCDVTDLQALEAVFKTYLPAEVYHLAAILSARAEEDLQRAWNINMTGLLHMLHLCVKFRVKKVFWPSSIAVFGKGSPRDLTPQRTIMNPSSVYGISKLAGERWCEYYYEHTGLDVRSIRYPGIVSWKAAPGGGTTDYAIEMYREAFKNRTYVSYIKKETILPMIYMEDAIRATVELMEADSAALHIRDSYNLAGLSFSPGDLALSIRKQIPEFRLHYVRNDPRQNIADSWPHSIDDQDARKDWGWKPFYTLERMTLEMLMHASDIP